MTQLKCSVVSCSHNSENCCCRSRIVIEGNTAQDVQHTCCGSYDQRTADSFRNRFESPDTQLEVECEAKNCAYNQDMYCHASRIGITGNGATRSGETACASFKMA